MHNSILRPHLRGSRTYEKPPSPSSGTEIKVRAADAKEVGVGNPAEETYCHPNEPRVPQLRLFVNRSSQPSVSRNFAEAVVFIDPMISSGNAAEAVGAKPVPPRWTVLKVVTGLAGGAAALLLVWFGLSAKLRAPERFLWLSPSEYAVALKPGPLTLIRYQAMRLTGPVYGWVFGRPTQLLIDCRMLALTSQAARETGLGRPLASNAASQRAWLLSPEAYEALGRRIRGLPGAVELSRPRLQTIDGGQAALFTGTTLALGSSQVPVGLSIDLLPRTAGGAFRLLVKVTSTGTAGPPESGCPCLKTNFNTVCQALVPNGGGLAIAGERAGEEESNYWFVLSLTAVDSAGKPLRR